MEATTARPVVVGADGSVPSQHAVRWAAREAALVHASLLVLTVRHSSRSTETAAGEGLAIAREESSAPAATRTRHGDPAAVLVEESADARLLVVGNRGLGALHGLLAGSVSGPVAARAHCPVAVVRGPVHPRDGAPVVLGVDGSPAGDAAVGYAFETADRRGVALLAVHGWRDELDDPEWSSAFEVDDPAEQERELISERLAGWSSRFPDVTVTQVLDDEAPVRALIAHAMQAQLLVLGSRGAGRLPGRWGSVSGAVLHEAQCPVVVVRGSLLEAA